MRPGRPSATAFRVAMRRAAHQLVDTPRVLEDPIALRIIGSERARSLADNRRQHASRFDRHLRAFLVARSRLAEDALAEAVARGVAQYVVLGAGLDTFAYRNPFPPGALTVFEVDHPDTQAWKRDLLGRTRIPVPENVRYVPVDFASEVLSDALPAAGFRTDAPAFFSWLGVTMYLEPEAVLATLRWIATALPTGSGVVFDYAIRPSTLGWFERLVFWGMARRVAAAGEPWRATFEPGALVRTLHTLGFREVSELRARDINARYFAGRSDRLQVGTLAGMVSARI